MKTLPDILDECDALVTEIDEADGPVSVRVGPTNLAMQTFDTASEAHELANEIRRCARIIARHAFQAGVSRGIKKADEIAEARRKATRQREADAIQRELVEASVSPPARAVDARRALEVVRAGGAKGGRR